MRLIQSLAVVCFTIGVVFADTCALADDAISYTDKKQKTTQKYFPMPGYSGMVAPGKYQSFTPIQQIIYGATVLMNPAAAKGVNIAYSYDMAVIPSLIDAGIEPSKPIGLVKVGKVDGRYINVTPKSYYETVALLKIIQDNPDLRKAVGKATDNYILLAGKPMIKNIPASKTWIAWNAQPDKSEKEIGIMKDTLENKKNGSPQQK